MPSNFNVVSKGLNCMLLMQINDVSMPSNFNAVSMGSNCMLLMQINDVTMPSNFFPMSYFELAWEPSKRGDK